MIVTICLISGISTTRSSSPIERLQPLVDVSARRLRIAEQVALAKWDSHTMVDDKLRETEVIKSAVKDGN